MHINQPELPFPEVEQPLLDTAQTAARLHVSTRTLIRWRVERRGPPFTRAGRRVLYRIVDVDSWLESNLQRAVAEPQQLGLPGID